jgi:hypothetical protein
MGCWMEIHNSDLPDWQNSHKCAQLYVKQFVLLEMGRINTDFSKAFDRVNHGLLLGTLTRKFRRPMIFWMGSYLTGCTQRVWVGEWRLLFV